MSQFVIPRRALSTSHSVSSKQRKETRRKKKGVLHVCLAVLPCAGIIPFHRPDPCADHHDERKVGQVVCGLVVLESEDGEDISVA